MLMESKVLEVVPQYLCFIKFEILNVPFGNCIMLGISKFVALVSNDYGRKAAQSSDADNR